MYESKLDKISKDTIKLKEKYEKEGWVCDRDTDEKIGFTKDGFIHDYCKKTGRLTELDGNWMVNLRQNNEKGC